MLATVAAMRRKIPEIGKDRVRDMARYRTGQAIRIAVTLKQVVVMLGDDYS